MHIAKTCNIMYNVYIVFMSSFFYSLPYHARIERLFRAYFYASRSLVLAHLRETR